MLYRVMVAGGMESVSNMPLTIRQVRDNERTQLPISITSSGTLKTVSH
jgi:acetyl-CoA acetyltransferase